MTAAAVMTAQYDRHSGHYYVARTKWEAGLPGLPSYAITLHVPNRSHTPAVRELTRFIRDRFARPAGPNEMPLKL